MRTVVIIPTYNERENIQPLTSAIYEQVPEANILVIDDGSPDGTGQVVDDLAEKDRRCHVIHRARKGGLGTASICGLRWAIDNQYDVAVMMDADFSHDPARLPALLKALSGADVAVGSRYVAMGGVENWSMLRRLASACVNLMSRALLGLSIKDTTGAYRAYKVIKIRQINYDNFISLGYSFQEEMAFRCKMAGCRMVEIPIIFRNRVYGESKVSLNEIIVSFTSLFRIAFSRPLARVLK